MGNGVSAEFCRRVLAYKWTGSQLRLLLAALFDPRPAGKREWARRAGLPVNHIETVIRQCQGYRALPDPLPRDPKDPGRIGLPVQPCSFWTCGIIFACESSVATQAVAGQALLGLATDRPGLAEALAVNPAPESGGVPDSGDSPFNVQRSTPEKEASAVSVERLTGPESGRLGWVEPETEQEAMQACHLLLGSGVGNHREMKEWGGRWRNRWRQDPDKLKRVLGAVREEQASRRKPDKTWGALASDLWDRFASKQP